VPVVGLPVVECGGGGCATACMGFPQCGQAAALVLTSRPHSGHLMRAIRLSPGLAGFFGFLTRIVRQETDRVKLGRFSARFPSGPRDWFMASRGFGCAARLRPRRVIQITRSGFGLANVTRRPITLAAISCPPTLPASFWTTKHLLEVRSEPRQSVMTGRAILHRSLSASSSSCLGWSRGERLCVA
jgi:hypothetical protein